MGLVREIFGPSKQEIWSQLSQDIGVDYEEEGFFKAGKDVLSHREWQITLDTYTVHSGKTTIVYTRMRAPCWTIYAGLALPTKTTPGSG